MKKLVLGILSIACFSAISNAQIELAPEAGVNLAKLAMGQSMGIDWKNKPSLKFGAAVNIPVLKGLYVQPGLFYAGKGVRFSEEQTISGVTAKAKMRINLDYLEIPVNLMYRYKIGKAGSIFATAGPYLGFALSGKIKADFEVGPPANIKESETEDLKIGKDRSDDIKPLDFGLNFGVGYQLPFGVFLRAQYGLGLSNINNNPDDNYSMKNRVISITLGYALPLGGK